MLTFVFCFFGYGIGLEGIENNNIHFGIYTPKTEYGWVVNEKEIYCNTVFVKE